MTATANVCAELMSSAGSYERLWAGNDADYCSRLVGGNHCCMTWTARPTSGQPHGSCSFMEAEELSKILTCQVFAPDLRGHGETVTSNDADLSLDTQLQDIGGILKALACDDEAILLVGHSMGAAVAAQAAARGVVPKLAGLVVIDVVEGTAMRALASMQSFLRGRPQQFASVEGAIEWCLRSATARNERAARVSMPAQLRERAEGDGWQWRVDLAKSEPYWSGWFGGLSQAFLDAAAPKLLLLAGVDRLDKALTVGQMQGKFQLVVLPKVGHAVQEDSPERVAATVATFCARNRLAVTTAAFKPGMPGC